MNLLLIISFSFTFLHPCSAVSADLGEYEAAYCCSSSYALQLTNSADSEAAILTRSSFAIIA